MTTLNTQKTLTLERLQQLHSSLTTRPSEDTFVQEPKDLRASLMPHQKHALAWLLWRENQKPSGGILGKFSIKRKKIDIVCQNLIVSNI